MKRRLAVALALLLAAYAVLDRLTGSTRPSSRDPVPVSALDTSAIEPVRDTVPVSAVPPAPPAPVRALRVPSLTAKAPERARLGEPLAVTVTVYCLKGTTRRGNDVREGIVAVDPRVFPLGSELDLWIRDEYVGRFLADDTGRLIKGARLDLWMPDCRQALVFGRKRGVAKLVQ